MANYIPKPEEWLLLPEEKKLLMNRTAHGRFGFAVLLKFFQSNGRFPYHRGELNKETLSIISEQLKIPIEAWYSLDWEGRTIKRIRAEIREWCGFREFTRSEYYDFKRWLINEIVPQEHREERLREALLQKCRGSRIEPPASAHIRRLIRSALQEHDDRFCKQIFQCLESAAFEKLDALLVIQQSEVDETEWTAWQNLKADPGKAGINSVKQAALRLNQVRRVGLPMDLFEGVPPKFTERYAKRATVEQPFELRRHTEPLRATILASYLYRRSEELTDHLVDLLVETIHTMGKAAANRIEAGLGEALQKAAGKMAKLYQMAKAAIEAPKGIIEEVIFPAAPEKWLKTLIQEEPPWAEFQELFFFCHFKFLSSSTPTHRSAQPTRYLTSWLSQAGCIVTGVKGGWYGH